MSLPAATSDYISSFAGGIMAVGQQPTTAGINQSLTSLAVSLRQMMSSVEDFALQVNNMGTAGLTALGFTAADAASVLTLTGYLSTLAGVYGGTVQQGGSGGTGASVFNFDNALSAVWAGQ
jgi:hypothetical protein